MKLTLDELIFIIHAARTPQGVLQTDDVFEGNTTREYFKEQNGLDYDSVEGIVERLEYKAWKELKDMGISHTVFGEVRDHLKRK